ncbi:MAG: ABC transporter permease [Acidimicrobiia bacterium]|nr:ABC transporter permease [Acidimicrobiia bacterium]MBT8216143.1 ABC transporter permease [Acidimicrobiia bacterium]NNF10341.1 ABC transporter permease [Acidimicrobiia bacterium]NNL69119.1 ABC transporter permease [Acidimicrobiia bacterium]
MIVAQADGDPFVRWDWIWGHLDLVWEKVLEHLVLTGIALGIGLTVALLLSALALRFRKTYAPITWVTGIAYSIPSLALFAFLVPITGFTILTAEIGLVSYTLLILIRNVVAGIDGVDPAIKEAATGMGYTRRRLFFQIELPLALPVIIAGLRIAGVTTIGLVTVTALIGQGGVGFFILRGLNRFFSTEIVLGTMLSVILAVAVDLSLLGLERILTPWSKRTGSAT